MKRILTVVSLPIVAATFVVIGLAPSSSAQNFQSKFSRQPPLSVAQSELVPVDSSTSITPTSSKTGKLPSQYGIVRSMSGDTLDVRMLDGTSKQVTLSGDLQSYASGLQRGAVVGFDTDAAGSLTKLESAEVDRTVSGTVSSIDGDQVTVISPSGESLTTPVSTATIARMALTPGKPLIVTTFKGTWATKLCCPATPAPISIAPVAPTIAPPPVGGAQFSPLPERPVPGLW